MGIPGEQKGLEVWMNGWESCEKVERTQVEHCFWGPIGWQESQRAETVVVV